MPLTLNSSGGGSVTVQTPSTASNRTLTLPDATGTVIYSDASENLQFNSGYGSVATAYGCRAWVNFNGTGTVAIRSSGNVSSITDNGTGAYTVNFTTAMPDTNYSSVMSGIQSTGTAGTGAQYMVGVDANATPSASSVKMYSKYCRPDTSGYADIEYVNVAIFR